MKVCMAKHIVYSANCTIISTLVAPEPVMASFVAIEANLNATKTALLEIASYLPIKQHPVRHKADIDFTCPQLFKRPHHKGGPEKRLSAAKAKAIGPFDCNRSNEV